MSPGTIHKIAAPAYSVERLNKNNLRDLALLHSQVYATRLNGDYFVRKYDTAYTKVGDLGFLAYGPGKIPIAYYGVIPCFIQYRDEVILAAQSADTMTHPGHRFKGLFVELSAMTFDLCREMGIRLIFGFPNQNSYHGAVNKLGWQMTGCMDCFTIPVRSWPLKSIFLKLGLEKSYDHLSDLVLDRKKATNGQMVNSVYMDGFGGVEHSQAYRQYKTYSPSKMIQFGDTKVWISTRHGLLIGDMEVTDEVKFLWIMDQLRSIARKMGLRKIQFHCSPGTTLHKRFSAISEPAPSFPMLFQNFGSSIPPAVIKFTFADIDIF